MSGRRYMGVSMKPPTDYILRYDFDGNLTDKSPNALHGVGSGTYSFDVGRKGLANEAIKFTAGCVKTPANLPLINNQVSFSFWMKNNGGTTAAILFELSSNFNYNNAFAITFNEGLTNRLNFSHRSPSYGMKRFDNHNFNQWSHVVITNNGNRDRDNFIKIYIDGELKLLTWGQYPNINTSNYGSFPLFIGARNASSLRFNGWMQELIAWNRELSAAEARGLYLNNL